MQQIHRKVYLTLLSNIQRVFLYALLIWNRGQVSGALDAALLSSARQSNTFRNYVASLAIDDDPSTCSVAGVGSYSTEQGWWQTDLGMDSILESVLLTNTLNVYESQYFTDFEVLFGPTDSISRDDPSITICCSFREKPKPGQIVLLNCSNPNQTIGRYVTIRRFGGFRQDALSLCDVKVFLSKLKDERVQKSENSEQERFPQLLDLDPTSARQSKTFSTFGAYMAVDGDNNTCSVAGVGSDSKDFGWWMVDLGDFKEVVSVVLVNSPNYYDYLYMNNFVIYVDKITSSFSEKCSSFDENSPVPKGGSVKITCSPRSIVGRYLAIRRFGGFRQDGLSLCEVFVYGFTDNYDKNLTLSQIDNSTRMQQLKPSAWRSSSIFLPYTIDLAFDGNPNTCFIVGEGSFSSNFAWVVIDLGGIYRLSSVEMLNHYRDYEAAFMNQLEIDISSSDDAGIPSSNRKFCSVFRQDQPVGINEELTMTCTSDDTLGRYVILKRLGGFRQDALAVCEMKIIVVSVASNNSSGEGVQTPITSSTPKTFTSSTHPTTSTTPTTTTTPATTTTTTMTTLATTTTTTTTTLATTTTTTTMTTSATTTTTTRTTPATTTKTTTLTTTTTPSSTSNPTTTSASTETATTSATTTATAVTTTSATISIPLVPSTSTPAVGSTYTNSTVLHTSWTTSPFAEQTSTSTRGNAMVCPSGYFECLADERCIEDRYKCDNYNDCGDNSDELNCDCERLNLFRCNNSKCVERAWICDKDDDCGDGSDEKNCKCTRTQYECDNKKCIPLSERCNGFANCEDASDEVRCDLCNEDDFQCDLNRCINSFEICNGQFDCDDGTDELNCNCTDGYKCNITGYCVAKDKICDMIRDCPDNSDEINCTCLNFQYRCRNGQCIHKDWLCDGIKDCPLGDDEENEGCPKCRPDQFTCFHRTSCLEKNQQCNGIRECLDNSDELQCLSLKDSIHGSLKKLLTLTIEGDDDYYVCGENWSQGWSLGACFYLGLGPPESYSLVTAPDISKFAVLRRATPDEDEFSFLNFFNKNSNCPSNTVVALKCSKETCGMRDESTEDFGANLLNADVAPRGAWPWNVQMFINNSYTCGGTLIDKNWILTAAHCVYKIEYPDNNIPAAMVFLVMGTNFLNSSIINITQFVNENRNSNAVQFSRVDRVIQHPMYNDDTVVYDFALIRLSSPVYWTDFVKPACLPISDPTGTTVPFYKTCLAIGHGRTYFLSTLSKFLLQERMSIVDYDDCIKDIIERTQFDIPYINSSIIRKVMFCAGLYPSVSSASTCKGDSGSPLLCQDINDKWVVHGIASFSFDDNISKCGNSIYSKVPTVVDWIEATLRTNM